MLRCLFGNPLQSSRVEPSWLTSDVLGLAAGIYQERAFDRLPILADALQDAGCEDPDLLAHCRTHGPHVRGCWVHRPGAGKGVRAGLQTPATGQQVKMRSPCPRPSVADLVA